ncbi:MAG: hypothetical protein AAGA93_26385 [Actinomycetota bacterium]
MGGLAIAKPWTPLTAAAAAALPAQLGVYEIADASGAVVRIGYAGGREPFGLRSSLAGEVEARLGTQFRVETTHGYLTRWEELLMLHRAEHGSLPAGNADRLTPVGRLRPLS